MIIDNVSTHRPRAKELLNKLMLVCKKHETNDVIDAMCELAEEVEIHTTKRFRSILKATTGVKEQITFKYKNWKGEVSERKVIPIIVWFGSTEFHKEPQLLLKAYDFDKQAERDFALCDIEYS